MSEALMVAMMGRQRTNEVADVALKWRAHAQQLEDQVSGMRETVQGLKAELRAVQDAHRLEVMIRAGLEAQRDHLRSLGTGTPSAWESSGQHFKNGESKTKLRVVYELAFDSMGRKLGVDNPVELRKD